MALWNERLAYPAIEMKTDHYVFRGNFMDLLLDAVCAVDQDGYFVFASAACERIFGYTPEEMIGKAVLDLVHPEDRAKTLQTMREVRAGQLKPHFENRYIRKDGKVVHIMWSARWSEADQLRVAIARDVTERKRAESMQAALYAISEAANAAEDLAALFRRIHEIIGELLPADNFFIALRDGETGELGFPYHADQQGRVPTPQALEFGVLSAEVIHTGRALLLTPDSTDPVSANAPTGRGSLTWLGVPLESHGGIMGALVVQSYTGAVHYTEQDKELLQFVSIQVAAAIERKRSYDRLQYLARHDQLTDLPNRALFQDRLRTALARVRRNRSRLAVLLLDMDEFKAVNDTFGHAMGDHLLREVALRLTHCVRESDTVGRLGGDEFVVLLDGISQPEDAAMVAGKILVTLGKAWAVRGETLRIAPSIGIAVYPEDGEDDEQLIRCADDAMYRAKRSGGNRYGGTRNHARNDTGSS